MAATIRLWLRIGPEFESFRYVMQCNEGNNLLLAVKLSLSQHPSPEVVALAADGKVLRVWINGYLASADLTVTRADQDEVLEVKEYMTVDDF
jgi:hypothetical protein